MNFANSAQGNVLPAGPRGPWRAMQHIPQRSGNRKDDFLHGTHRTVCRVDLVQTAAHHGFAVGMAKAAKATARPPTPFTVYRVDHTFSSFASYAQGSALPIELMGPWGVV